jgi:hypothetical protein
MKGAFRIAALAVATLAVAGSARAAQFQFAGYLGGTGAVGWHPLTLHAGHRYRFTAAGQPGMRLSLRLSLGSAILKEKPAEGSEVRMSFQPPASGIYWLRVQSAAGEGDYRLAVEAR